MQKQWLIAGWMLACSLLSVSGLYASGEDHGHGTETHATNGHDTHGHEDDGKFDPVPVIMHHIKDAHEWHILGEGAHSVTIPLPVIVYTEEHGLDVFLSSAFHHDDNGTHLAEGKYLKYHEQIYLANADGQLDMEMGEDGHHHPTNAKPLDFSITKNVASMFLSVILLLFLFIGAARSYAGNGVPKGIAKFMEPLVLFVRDEIAIPNIGEEKAPKFMGYLLTVFFFIWINNLLGLIPFFPGGANLSGNIAFTMVLAVFTLIITNVSANKAYWSHIFLPPVPKPMYPIMWPVEILGIFTKPFALMLRLFANITAGHILILSLVSLIFMLGTLAVSPVSVAFMIFMFCLELLVAALQAFIFTLLSALFIGMAVEDHHHDEAAHEAH